jgi:hypothetical protein
MVHKERFVANFKAITQHCRKGLKQTTKIIMSAYVRIPVRELNPEPADQKGGSPGM